MSQSATTPDGPSPEPTAATGNTPTGSTGPYTPPPGLRRYLRRLSALAVVAGALTAGIAVSQPAKHTEAMPPPSPCWTKAYLLPWDEWVVTSNC